MNLRYKFEHLHIPALLNSRDITSYIILCFQETPKLFQHFNVHSWSNLTTFFISYENWIFNL